ncbi:MAG: hypothetical protein GXY55_04070 [Phycisphaerae bacterium]|nr:hypothetical protein [Phycisphaerae bacterium]
MTGILVLGLASGWSAASGDELPDLVEAPTAALWVEGDFAPQAWWPEQLVLPQGVGMPVLHVADGVAEFRFGHDVLAGLDEATLLNLFVQFKDLVAHSPEVRDVRLTCDGELLSSYLAPVKVDFNNAPPPLDPKAIAGGVGVAATQGLDGLNITIGPSHGRFWNGSGWYWQRSDPCGLGEAVLEDTNSIRLMQFLYQYLSQDGATVHVPRELNESNCCHPNTSLHWWKMAAYAWLMNAGLPCSVYANSSGICGSYVGSVTRVNDDIRARPLFADYRGSHIYIAHHSNAGGGGTASGTEVYRDSAMEHPAHEANSLTLAQTVKTNLDAAIRDIYDASWPIRNGGAPRDSAGGFGEIRIPNRPACLVELAFHDNCSKDAVYLTDNFFRSATQWGLYKAVCDYFGRTPTWDKYSNEYVSDNLPTQVQAGQTFSATIVMRNRGVLWNAARGFRLGAVGDSDPFTGTTRHTISGEVRPGQDYTFTFSMTAPTTPGIHTTDWRMVRDGVSWFGPTVTKQIEVMGAPVVTQHPTDQSLYFGDYAQFSVQAGGTEPLYYQWQKDGEDLPTDGHFLMSRTATLTVWNVVAADAGAYRCVVTNSYGTTTSNAANLVVLGPRPVPGDQDGDSDVDMDDFGAFQACLSGPGAMVGSPCLWADLENDGDVDSLDLPKFRACFSGAGVPGNPDCLE